MLANLESTARYIRHVGRPVTEELYQALIKFRDKTLERVAGETGEEDNWLGNMSREYFFRSESRIIGVSVPEQRTVDLVVKKVKLPPEKGATVQFWGVELENGKWKSDLAPFSLPLVSKGLRDEKYGWADPNELEEIGKVITTGQLVSRKVFNNIKG